VMPRFYFHVRTNGKLAEDNTGSQFDNARHATAHAIRSMPALLQSALQDAKTYVTTEICDESRTVGVVRATIILETRREATSGDG
jgi:hypothetical protein